MGHLKIASVFKVNISMQDGHSDHPHDHRQGKRYVVNLSYYTWHVTCIGKMTA